MDVGWWPKSCGVLNSFFQIMNDILPEGDVPPSWRKTLFQTFPKSHRARVPADFRPVASLRLLYNVFAYLMLGRIEETLEQHELEEQYGFRSGRRIEEHLLTTNVVIDKTLLANVPLWIVSLDLSKVFDRVNWDSLWEGLLRHGVSEHVVWALHLIYWEQRAKSSANRILVENSASKLACGKVAFSAPDCFHVYWKWH